MNRRNIYSPRTSKTGKINGPHTSMQDGGSSAKVEIETGEAVIGNPDNMTIFGGAKPHTISSRGFLVNGARHGQKNAAGSEGIPLASTDSVYVASAKINDKGQNDFKNSQAKEAAKYLKYFESAENNPQDRFLNNPVALSMLDNEMAIMEQKHNEGRFMKKLQGLLKKKDRQYEEIMGFIMQEAPNEAMAMMGQTPEGMGPEAQAAIQQGEQPMPQIGPEENNPAELPMAQLGGMYNNFYNTPSSQLQSLNTLNAENEKKNRQTVDPSIMSPEERHKFNMQTTMGNNYMYGGRRNYQIGGRDAMDASMKQHRRESMGLPGALQGGPQVTTKDVDPQSVSPNQPNYQGYGVMANQTREKLPWQQLPGLVEKHNNATVAKGTPGTDMRSLSNLADKAGTHTSGLSNFLPKRVSQLYPGMVKGWDKIGDGGTDILTPEGKAKAKELGLTDAEIASTDWNNFDSSPLYKKMFSKDIAAKTQEFGRSKLGGMSESAQAAQRQKEFGSVGALMLDDLNSLKPGESFGSTHANSGYKRMINDVIHSDAYKNLKSDDEKIKYLNNYAKASEYSRDANKHFSTITQRGSAPEEVSRKEVLSMGESEQTGERTPEKPDLSKGIDGERLSFNQAFKKAKDLGVEIFTWRGRQYAAKTKSESSPEELARMKQAEQSYRQANETGRGMVGSQPGQESFARHASGSVQRNPQAPAARTNQANFEVLNRSDYLRRSGRERKEFGGMTMANKIQLMNGQRVSFEKGGRSYSGIVNNYNPSTGDFDLL